MSKYHADGDCNPEHCRECDWQIEQEQNAHMERVCGGYANCSICKDKHDCDTSYEVTCLACPVVA